MYCIEETHILADPLKRIRDEVFAHSLLNERSNIVDLFGSHLVLKKNNRILAGVTYTTDMDPLKEWTKKRLNVLYPYTFLCRGFAVPEMNGSRFGYFKLAVIEGLGNAAKENRLVLTAVRTNNKKVKSFLGNLGFEAREKFHSYHSTKNVPVELELQQLELTDLTLKKLDDERSQIIFNLQQTFQKLSGTP